MTPDIEKKRRELFDQFCADKGYGRFSTRELLWPCFNAALDAVEIELPQAQNPAVEDDRRWHSIRNQTIAACKRAITATGLGLRIK